MYVDISTRRLAFGKNSGARLADVDANYLVWMLSTIARLTHLERRMIEAELDSRSARSGGSEQSGSQGANNFRTASVKLPAGITSGDLLQIVAAGRQSLAKRHHPDVGGDTSIMQRLNAAADFLEAQARALEVVA